MSARRSNQLDDENILKDYPAPDIKETLQHLAVIGMASDALWHHHLRKHYIGYPKTLHTCGIYVFWAAVWYCATNSGDWAHAAVAKDPDKIPPVAVPEYDGIWDHGAVSSAAQTKSLLRRSERVHLAAACTFTIVPVLARLTYAYRPWFWQRRLPGKIIWLCGAAYTTCISLGGIQAVAQSRSRLQGGHGSKQVKAE